jgi:hypothetical protein
MDTLAVSPVVLEPRVGWGGRKFHGGLQDCRVMSGDGI